MNMLGVNFDAFYYWRIFPLIICAIAFLLLNYKKRVNTINAFVSVTNTSLVSNYSSIKNIMRMFLFSLSVIFLFFTILRPQWGKLDETIEQQGRDLIIALDVSRSMLAQDLKPNRLEFAKNKIRSLLQQLNCERVSLILFAGNPVVQCPLTTDYTAFNMFLDQVDAQTISNGTTALDAAIAKVLQIYEQIPERKQKLLVIFTDGEDFSSDLATIKQKAQEIGLRIFTLGIGSEEGAPIPLLDDNNKIIGHQNDQKGNVVISQLNEGILKTLAQDSGGIYFTGTSDDTDIKKLIAQVDLYEKEKFEQKKFTALQERYPLFAAISFICLLLEWLL